MSIPWNTVHPPSLEFIAQFGDGEKPQSNRLMVISVIVNLDKVVLSDLTMLPSENVTIEAYDNDESLRTPDDMLIR
ncbi:hypothetical protein AB6A40_011204 [Gnathostoma spinigerum]|uniref:Uncharacterized protein n=1 Tax=Gnathostoma spinigerum TaxID=75299 RepID=A0ABD6F4E6_9BILA